MVYFPLKAEDLGGMCIRPNEKHLCLVNILVGGGNK